MRDDARLRRARRIFLFVCWIPLAVFFGAHAYVDQFDGWGQWAAAPVLLLPVGLSAPVLVAGALVARDERGRGGVRIGTWFGLALAAVPVGWLVWRVIAAP